MSLRERVEQALNHSSAENGSDTPDFILANYLLGCLAAFDEGGPRPRGLVRPRQERCRR